MKNFDRGFEILHYSYRSKWASGEKFAKTLGMYDEDSDVPDWQYYVLNLVFRATGDFKEMCMLDTKDWKETKVCIDTDKYEQYLNGLTHEFSEDREPVGEYNGQPTYEWTTVNNSGIDRSSLFVMGYVDNYSSFLSYNEKFDVFRVHEYLQHNPATIGILQFIDQLKEGKSYGVTCDYNQFYSCIKSLEFWWD
jgi:hypothetical protein